MTPPTTQPSTPPLPAGFRVVLDPDARWLDESTLFGGAPARVLRLPPAGRTAWAALETGPVGSAAAGVLARRLTDAGVAHPVPPAAGRPDVTVVVPVRDRTDALATCLAAQGRDHRVVVVDDGSADPAAVAEVAAEHRAGLVRLPDNRGPAAARNAGLGEVTSEFVAFLDSDCVPAPGWIDALAGHFADPLVAAVAPRVTPIGSTGTWAGRHAVASGSLDLGDRAARVVPGTRVSYVPTAALLVRRSALDEHGWFDPALRYGEDVDLVWRLHEAGQRIRYDPTVRIGHREPGTWPELLAKRFRYGTSAGPLARRHPDSLAPLVLHPWPAAAVAGLLASNPVVAGLSFAGSVVAMRRTLARAHVPDTGVVRAMAGGVYQTWLGVGRYGTQFAAPLLAAALVLPGGRWRRRAAVASLLLGPPLTTWARRRPFDPVRFVAGSLADDVAYGAGVWAGAVRARTIRPLLPAVAWRPFRISRTSVPPG